MNVSTKALILDIFGLTFCACILVVAISGTVLVLRHFWHVWKDD